MDLICLFTRLLRYFSHLNKRWRNILCATLESKVSGKVFCSNIYLFDVCYSMRGYTSVFAYYPQSEQKQCCSMLTLGLIRQNEDRKVERNIITVLIAFIIFLLWHLTCLSFKLHGFFSFCTERLDMQEGRFYGFGFLLFWCFYRVGKVATPVSCRFLYDRHELYSVYLCAGMMGMITLFLWLE